MDKRQHIVVVEDEAAQRQLLFDYLTKHGYRVTGFQSGVGLRRLVEREMPALVLLDVGLPGEDGFAVARWLREGVQPSIRQSAKAHSVRPWSAGRVANKPPISPLANEVGTAVAV